MSENTVCTFIDAHFAELVLRVIDEVEYPRLMCKGEKEAVRKGLMLLLDRQSANECEYWDGESNFCALQRPADLVKHGKWIKISNRNYKCSCCNAWWSVNGDSTMKDFEYYPNCGAKMEEN